jgi:hypothetical protein
MGNLVFVKHRLFPFPLESGPSHTCRLSNILQNGLAVQNPTIRIFDWILQRGLRTVSRDTKKQFINPGLQLPGWLCGLTIRPRARLAVEPVISVHISLCSCLRSNSRSIFLSMFQSIRTSYRTTDDVRRLLDTVADAVHSAVGPEHRNWMVVDQQNLPPGWLWWWWLPPRNWPVMRACLRTGTLRRVALRIATAAVGHAHERQSQYKRTEQDEQGDVAVFHATPPPSL